jgi:hypothetical protein
MPGSDRCVYSSMTIIPVDVGSLNEGEEFWLGGIRYVVLENTNAKLVKCADIRRSGTNLNLGQETTVEIER